MCCKIFFQPGWYITIHVKDVPETLWSNFVETGAPLVLIGMYPHEHKMSVLNVVLKRTPNYDVPIASKERLIIQCGYRRFIVNPIFSLHTIATKYKVWFCFESEKKSLIFVWFLVWKILSAWFCGGCNFLCAHSVSTSASFVL